METMRLHQGMDIDTASQIVNYQLKVKDFDVFKDYRGDSSTEGSLVKEISRFTVIYLQNTLLSLEGQKYAYIDYKNRINLALVDKLSYLRFDIPFKLNFADLYFAKSSRFNINNDHFPAKIDTIKYNMINKETLFKTQNLQGNRAMNLFIRACKRV
jgi:hypothetical protein